MSDLGMKITEIEIIRKQGKDPEYKTRIIDRSELEDHKVEQPSQENPADTMMSGTTTNAGISQQPMIENYNNPYSIPVYAYGMYDFNPQIIGPITNEMQEMLMNQANMNMMYNPEYYQNMSQNYSMNQAGYYDFAQDNQNMIRQGFNNISKFEVAIFSVFAYHIITNSYNNFEINLTPI